MPISAGALPLDLMDEGVGRLRGGVFLALVAIAVIASLFPAARAARMPVVDALRHV
jgi:putative ABC transport system permease protein